MPSSGRFGPAGVNATVANGSRRGGAGLLVAAALVGAFFLGVRQAPPTTAAPPVVPLSVRVDVDGVQADAGLVKHTWGTELKLEATGLENGGAYTVTFTRTDGTEVAGGTFLGNRPEPVALQSERGTAHRRRGSGAGQ